MGAVLLFLASIIANVVFSEENLTDPLRVMIVAIVPLSVLRLHAEMLRARKLTWQFAILDSIDISLLNLLMLPLFSWYGVFRG